MANHGPSYGLDAELEAKRASQWDPALEKEVLDWIGSITGEHVSTIAEGLKSGVLLCKLANKLKAGSVTKINTGAMPFTQMENINAFLNFARSYGVPNPDLFMTVDLYENKNPNQVVKCLATLKRRAGGGGSTVAKPGQVSLTSDVPSKAPAPASPSKPAATSAPSRGHSGSAPPASTGGASSNFCSNCGTKATGAKFCSNCGTKL